MQFLLAKGASNGFACTRKEINVRINNLKKNWIARWFFHFFPIDRTPLPPLPSGQWFKCGGQRGKEIILRRNDRARNYASEEEARSKRSQNKTSNRGSRFANSQPLLMMLPREWTTFISHCFWPFAKNLGNLPWLM